MKKLLCAILWISVSCNAIIYAQSTKSQFSIIPQPLNIEEFSGEFKFTTRSKIYIDQDNEELKLLSEMLSDQLEHMTGFKIPVIEKSEPLAEKNAVILTMKQGNDLGKEGYLLSVRPKQLIVKATDGQGIFYGLQTIYQLLPANTMGQSKNSSISIPAVDIVDKPRYSWRGMMLDVGRYFYPVSFIKKFIDYLAMHKMNTFHWHLVEDHGWRIEIKKHPELTEVGAWRKGTQINPGRQIDHKIHGGYYTQDQIREVVAYAKERYVTIIPEIEMPGHTLSALAAYPELSCTGGPFEMLVQWGIQDDIYCAGNEKTFKFLEDVLSEVADLFPSPIIHIGGDEAPKKRWKACEKCQARIKNEGLKDEHELQSYFIKRIEKFLLTKNKNIIGWDEILEGGLAPNASVMSWRGIKGGITAAKQHHNVVMSPTSHMYFDYYQGDPSLEPAAIGGLTTLQKVYSYEPTPADLLPEEEKYILGVQGNIWSEYIHSPEKVEYMAFPRAAALAEVAWTQPEYKDWEIFKRKMEKQYLRYEGLGINYALSAYNVRQEVEIDSTAQKATVTFKSDNYNPQIYYTLDGSEPTPDALKYHQPFEVDEPVIINAATFKNGKRISEISQQYINRARLNQSNNKQEL
jgi:hexosaminidase